MEHLKSRLRATAAVALALAALAGCGGDDPAPPDPPAEEVADPRGERKPRAGVVAVSADPSGKPAFQEDSLEAEAGVVRAELANLTSTSHSLCIEKEGQGALGCTGTFSGDRATLRLRLEPGEYTFFCSVEGHREAGMTGELVVR